MYGTIFNPHRRPIIGKEYIELLEKHEPIIQWDSESEEAYFEFSGPDVEDGEAQVWYPTLYSIKYDLNNYIKLILEKDWTWLRISILGV
jgi:hypothetical protein